MNLLETKRLVRKIVELLRGGGDAALAPKLAQDFANACRAVVHRLNQCEAMIASGDQVQALQLAETPPHLLDLVTVVEFREAVEWRTYCREHALPVAETLDDRAVLALNDCYTRGIASDHPLYREYRGAMVRKDDNTALQVLRSITRLNPSDENAAAERARLDRKVLGERLAALAAMLDQASPGEVAGAVVAIESAAFQSSPAGVVWTHAQAIRCNVLLDHISKDRERNDWRSALDSLDLISALEREWEFALEPSAQARFDELRLWAEGERHKNERERQFQSLLVQLQHLIHLSEEKEISAREISLSELRDDLAALRKTWRSIEEFARAVPDELSGRYHKRAALLQADVSRRMKRRVMILGATAAAALVVISVATWMFLQHLKAGEFVRQLSHAREQRLVRTAEKFVTMLRGGDRRLAGRATLQTALAETEAFLRRERGAAEAFAAAFQALPGALNDITGAAQLRAMQQQFANATNLLAQLAPDLRSEQEPKLKAFGQSWTRHLFERSRDLNRAMEQGVTRAEQIAARLNFAAGVADARAVLATFAPELARLNEDEQSFGDIVPWRADAIQRLRELRRKHQWFAGEIAKFDEALMSLARARETAEHNVQLAVLSRSEFSGAPEARAAIFALDLQPSDEGLLRALVCGGSRSLWDYFKSYSANDFVPKAVMPAEKSKFLTLRNEEAISAEHYRYMIALGPEGKNSAHWLTSGIISTNEIGWTKIPAFVGSDTATSFQLRSTEYGWFGGQMRLSRDSIVHEAKLIGACRETAPFFTLSLPRFVALHNDTFQFPVLKALDDLKRSEEGSPVFRGYLFLRLCEMTQFQPEAWGLPFAPSLTEDWNALTEAGGGEIRSGDWYVLARVQKWTPVIEEFFRRIRTKSYWDQAQAVARVYREALSAGVQYTGHADVKGAPQLHETTAHEIWGWSASERAPAVLMVRDKESWKTIAKPLPYSPLYAFGPGRATVLGKTGLENADTKLAAALPPVFRKL